MSNDVDWDKAEEVEVQQGTFIGWGRIGQVVAGTVMRYSSDGAKDFNGNPCPSLEIELLSDATNFKDKGTREETIKAGERAAITAGQANLKRALEEAQPKPTDKIRIEYVADYKTASGTGKEFSVKIVRGSGNPWD